MTACSLAALGIALYLTWTKLAGESPTCGPLHGCETVNSSAYSTILGVPTALFGSLQSGIVVMAALRWWRVADRRALLLAYGLGLTSLPILAWLAYVEVAIIGAVCVWCVGYAVATVAAWLLATRAVMRRSDR